MNKGQKNANQINNKIKILKLKSKISEMKTSLTSL